MQPLQQYAPVGVGAVFALTMFIWGIVLVVGLSGGSERAAASGTAFIILVTITVGKGLLTYYNILKPDENDELKTQKLAARGFGGLFFVFIVISGLIGPYRDMIILSSIAYGFLGLAITSIMNVYLLIRKSDGDQTLLPGGGNLGGIGSAV